MKGIPSIAGVPKESRPVIEALKENVEELRAMRGSKIDTLQNTATTSDIISKINEIIARLQG
jgi:hypothetical protein